MSSKILICFKFCYKFAVGLNTKLGTSISRYEWEYLSTSGTFHTQYTCISFSCLVIQSCFQSLHLYLSEKMG